jgi:phosphatidylinositol alpha-1,6-mannosyltransferase
VGTSLLLTYDFPPHGGGIARMMGELALRFPPQSLVVSTGRQPGSAESDARFPQPIDRAPIAAKHLRTLNGLALWSWRAGGLVRRYAPGFTWCGNLKPAAYPARWLKARYDVPYGVVVYGTDLLLLDASIRRSAIKRRTTRLLLGGAAVIVAISDWTAELGRHVLGTLDLPADGGRIRTVPLGTDPGHFRPGVDSRAVRQSFGLEGGPWLLTVARLEGHKGIDTTIRAMPAIRARVPGARYMIAGTGPRRPFFEQTVAELGLGDAVKFLGPVSEADLPAVYNAADLYVGASRVHDLMAEGFGIAIVEASACGLAVVGGRSGGIPDAVRDGETGILVDPDRPEAVAAGVVQLLDNDDLRRRLGANGRRAAETFYNWERVARDFIRIDAEFRRPEPPAR